MSNTSKTESLKQIETKKVQITGFTEGQRKDDLNKIKQKMQKNGWDLSEYTEEGILKSFAIFKRELSFKNSKNNMTLKTKEIVLGSVGLIIVIMIVLASMESEEDKNAMFLKSNLEEARLIDDESRANLINKYIDQLNIIADERENFYNCVTEMIFTKAETLEVGEVSSWCHNEYKTNNNQLVTKHHDLSGIKQQFSAWDGSHKRLVEFIKTSMNDQDSFKHINTTYRLVLSEEDPHLIVKMTYSGNNAFGARVKGNLLAKADITDGSILEIIESN